MVVGVTIDVDESLVSVVPRQVANNAIHTKRPSALLQLETQSWSLGDRRSTFMGIVMHKAAALLLVLCVPIVKPARSDDLVTFSLQEHGRFTTHVSRASKWLVQHIAHGTLTDAAEIGPLTLVAWYDPTLSPQDKNTLAAYAITDSLWASRALSLQHPSESEAIYESLSRLDCLTNNLHEVLFQRIGRIHHRFDEKDLVHGRLIGTMKCNSKLLQVRTFRTRYDADYSIGHPALFAEHAVYQALFEFWNGNTEIARQRISDVLESSAKKRAAVLWDRERRILVDHVTSKDYARFVAGETQSCRQFTFKLALIVYAVRVMDVSLEDRSILNQMQETVWSAQLASGGVAHFFDTDAGGKITPCPGATAEATAIAILSQTVVPAQQ